MLDDVSVAVVGCHDAIWSGGEVPRSSRVDVFTCYSGGNFN